MRRVDQDELIVARSKIDVPFQHFQFIARVFVQTDFADAQHIRAVQELGNNVDDLLGQFEVLGFFGVDAQPAKVGQAELGSALGLVLGQLAELIKKPIYGTAVESGPKRRFANGGTTGSGQPQVIISHPADHVGVWFDVFHGRVERA